MLASLLTVAAPAHSQASPDAMPEASANLLSGDYATKGVFKDYPQYKPIFNNDDKTYYFPKTYAIRGVALDNYNKILTDKGMEQLSPLVPQPSQDESLRFTLLSVDPLFNKDGILSSNNNVAKLSASENVMASEPFRAKGDCPVMLDLRFVSSSNQLRLAYFYVTPKMARALTESAARYRAEYKTTLPDMNDRDRVEELKKESQFKYFIFKGLADTKQQYAKFDDYNLGLAAAIHAQLIPAFTIASDIINRNYVSVSPPADRPDLNISDLKGGNNLGNAWTDAYKFSNFARCTVVGTQFTLAYFGDDYTDSYISGEGSSQTVNYFPPDTFIYPVILRDKSSSCNNDVNMVNGVPTLDVEISKVCHSVSQLSYLSYYNGNRFDANVTEETLNKYLGQPASFSFPYRYVSLLTEKERNLNLLAFEDSDSPFTNGGNYQDAIFDVLGVKAIANRPYTSSRIYVEASPVSKTNASKHKNLYGHTLRLSSETGMAMSSRYLGIPDVYYSQDRWHSSPAFSLLEIMREDRQEPVAHVIFRKELVIPSSLGSYQNPYQSSSTRCAILYKSLTHKQFTEIPATADGNLDFSSLDWDSEEDLLVGNYQFINGDWSGTAEISVDIPLDRIEGLHDEFDHEFNTASERYNYSAHFVGFSGYVISSENTDCVVIPKSDVEVELSGEIEFEAGVNGEIPAIGNASATRRYLSVKVYNDPAIYNKETVSSYTVMSAGKEICSISRHGDEWTADNNAEVISYDPGTDGESGTYGWVVVHAPAAVSDDSESYWVRINTLVNEPTNPIAASRSAKKTAARANTYGTPQASAPSLDDLVTFEISANPDALTGDNRAVWGVRSSWTLSEAVNPEGVRFNQWRTYDNMRDRPADIASDIVVHGNILSDNTPATGYVAPFEYGIFLNAHFGTDNNVLTVDGRNHTNLDVLVTNMADDATDISVDATYTLHAYIPEHQLIHAPAIRKALRAKDSDVDPRKYILVKKQVSLQMDDIRGDDVITGIGNIDAGTDGEPEYFNLQGLRIADPTPGQIVIRRTGSTVEKIIVN